MQWNHSKNEDPSWQGMMLLDVEIHIQEKDLIYTRLEGGEKSINLLFTFEKEKNNKGPHKMKWTSSNFVKYKQWIKDVDLYDNQGI